MAILPEVAKRRSVEDPWYTAIYRDPYRLWWAPALFLFPVEFVVLDYLLGDSAQDALTISALLALAYTLGCFVRLRRSRK